jgi:protein-L-isoaspartate(D-aspartate) O-methyltransferase
MSTSASADTPEALHARMIDRILRAGHARNPNVARALRAVPRHLFVPDAPVADAYADIAVITKRAANGAPLSCASVPTVVAMMLDQLDAQPGDRILEIGAGTGYNAALLAELVGESGHVTTVDVDPEVTAQARDALDVTGYSGVDVLTRDGALGAPEHAPYDRIIVTVGAWDLSAAWTTQLVPSGRLVVPLRWRGQTHAVAFTRDGDTLRSERMDLCGFVPMIGQETEREATIDANGAVTIYWDVDQPINPELLQGVLDRPRCEVWSGVTVGSQEPFSGVWLRLTATEPGTCRIAVEQEAITAGICTPAIPSRSPALVEGDSLAYFTFRRQPTEPGAPTRSELGAIGHGPNASPLAERLTAQIQAWGNDRTATPYITAHPASTTTDAPPDVLITISKRECQLHLSL